MYELFGGLERNGANSANSKYTERLLDAYLIQSDGVNINVEITQKMRTAHYRVVAPKIGIATQVLLKNIKERLINTFDISSSELLDKEIVKRLNQEFVKAAKKLLNEDLPNMEEETSNYLILNLRNEVFGLGQLQFLIDDEKIEEIVVNSTKEPVRIYHKDYGWIKTNIFLTSENEILNHAHQIARRVGKEITTLNPRLDAYLITGDRVNATLSPISMKGNTITIRKFARNPWTISDFIKNGTISTDAAALIWLAMQYEMNIIVSGGTGSGKTSFLNTIMPFVPPNHRIISIEDTRELQLPEFLYWCPLMTRDPNPEGKGEISMLDLLINSLRMRPDRIVMGEIRKQKEAEVLFEAMHTGHSVYATLHANNCAQTINRLTNSPISIPHNMLEAVHLNVVMHRDRRKGFRRILEIGEFVPTPLKGLDETRCTPKLLYRWNPRVDAIEATTENAGIYEKIEAYTGIPREEIETDLEKKKGILRWMAENGLRAIEDVGQMMNHYYLDPGVLDHAALSGVDPKEFLEEQKEKEACENDRS